MLLFPIAGCLLGAVLLFFFKGFVISQYIAQSKLFTDYFYFVFPLTVFLTFTRAFNSYAAALYKTTIPSFIDDILNRILLILVILLYFFGIINFDQFVLSFISIYAIQALLVFGYIYFVDKPSIKIDLPFLKKINFYAMMRYGLLLMLTSISSVSLKFLDSIMIAKYLPLAFVGIYSIAAFIGAVIETPLLSMERIAIAKVAHSWATNNVEEVRKIYFQSAKYMALLGGILLVGVIANIHDLLALLPEEYRQGASITALISFAAFINMATGVNYSIIYNSQKYIYGFIFVLILLFFTVAGNIILIPRYGILGAAISTALSSIVFNLLKYFFIWKVFKMQPFDISTLKILGVIFLSYAVNYFLPQTGNHIVNIIFHSFIIALVYGAATYFFKIVPEFHKYIPFIASK